LLLSLAALDDLFRKKLGEKSRQRAAPSLAIGRQTGAQGFGEGFGIGKAPLRIFLQRPFQRRFQAWKQLGALLGPGNFGLPHLV
jgi:hypothetical protein